MANHTGIYHWSCSWQQCTRRRRRRSPAKSAPPPSSKRKRERERERERHDQSDYVIAIIDKGRTGQKKKKKEKRMKMTVWRRRRRCGGQDTEVEEDKRVLSCSVFISVNRCYSRGMRTRCVCVCVCCFRCSSACCCCCWWWWWWWLWWLIELITTGQAGRQAGRKVSSLIQFGLLCLCLLFPLQAHTLCFQCITSHQWQIGNCVWVCTEEKEPDLLLLLLIMFFFSFFLYDQSGEQH